MRLPIKAMWGLIFAAGVFMAFYGCYAIVTEYLRSPVVVSYVIQGAELLHLPDIVVCPFNRYNKTYIEYTSLTRPRLSTMVLPPSRQLNISKELVQGLEFIFPLPFMLPFQSSFYREKIGPKFNLSLLEEELNGVLEEKMLTFDQFLAEATPGTQSPSPNLLPSPVNLAPGRRLHGPLPGAQELLQLQDGDDVGGEVLPNRAPLPPDRPRHRPRRQGPLLLHQPGSFKGGRSCS